MIALLVAAAITSVDARCAERIGFYQPPQGIVSTPKMAAQVAETFLTPIYGASTIRRELPFKVRLESGVWIVEGKDLPPMMAGGVVQIQICRANGLVLRVVHGK